MQMTSTHQIADKISFIHSSLKSEFGNDNLGNKSDPIDELVFILLSVKTDHKHYDSLWNSFKNRFADWGEVLRSSEAEIASAIAFGGLQTQKASRIKRALQSIVQRTGTLDLSMLRNLSDEETEEFLISLDGVGKKVARCVMMYSLGRDVFPVDSNVERVFRRLGLVRKSERDIADVAQDIVPRRMRYSLHVNMVHLGREICRDREPLCTTCPLREICPSGGACA